MKSGIAKPINSAWLPDRPYCSMSIKYMGPIDPNFLMKNDKAKSVQIRDGMICYLISAY
jgi:hypothetical protein